MGLRFYSGSNFPFSYCFFHGPYNSAALLRCLLQVNSSSSSDCRLRVKFYLFVCIVVSVSVVDSP